MELDLINNWFMLRDLQDPLKVNDAKIRDPDVSRQA